jgi:hypothetical protein
VSGDRNPITIGAALQVAVEREACSVVDNSYPDMINRTLMAAMIARIAVQAWPP